MYYLLLGLGLACMATGMFVVGFAVPSRETTFGSALLIVGAVTFTGGLIAIGLAAAVSELRRVVTALKARIPAVPRPLRPVDHKDGGEKRPGPPRMAPPPRPGAEGPHPAPPRTAPAPPAPPPLSAEAPPAAPSPMPSVQAPGLRNPGPEWLRRAIAEIESTPDPADTTTARAYVRDEGRPAEAWPRLGAAPAAPEPSREEMPAPPRSLFDMAWDRPRQSNEGNRAEQRAELPVEPRRPVEPMRPVEPIRSAEPRPAPPPVSPAPPPAAPPPPRPEPRPAVLKSGVIDEMAYTLFADGSIEANMPDGTMRFGSIEELRQHLEKHES
jgi:hypothetical protein